MAVPILLFVGTFGMLLLTFSIIYFLVYHQKKIKIKNAALKKLEDEKQQIMVRASIKFQEEERNRIAADLHDDAGPLLATVRLYLNENMVNLDKHTLVQNVMAARGVVDEAIMLIRNISHSLMPPTLKNFGLESAITDLFNKINGSGSMSASVRFHDYRVRLTTDQELLVFRIVQELVNNIIKHSNAGFIHLTEHVGGRGKMYIRVHHDGTGLTQSEYERLNDSALGLGLKNISSRIKVLKGNIHFELDSSHTYYKVNLEIPMEKVAKEIKMTV
ncbi:MAG: ATP-binding protein [Chitinophagaceae bacterium]